MSFETVTSQLLDEWCEAMLALQIDEPENPVRHGALSCPACGDHIHGRCWEALYPFLSMARSTGDERYVRAAVQLFDWSANVTRDNGAWSNDLNPTAWQGTTIFGAIALAEALHHHGDLLSAEQVERWRARLEMAASGYLWTDFVALDFTNVNYGFTAIYGFDLIGRVLDNQKYLTRSAQLAEHVTEFLTSPHALIFGEGKPTRNRSGRGLRAVDLGYNVEESLNGPVLYALHNNRADLLEHLERSMNGHLEFMLSDGAWDNSWGTRQFKWTYWGSRTSDGCQPAFALMADRNPAFGAAAFRNAELLASCTHNGLLHGGPHYVAHQVPPCVHHTFAHAKAFAFLRDNRSALPAISRDTALPRQTADGVQDFPEIAVSLAARGEWRATVSAYDSIYRAGADPDHILHATGGSLALLRHERIGTLLAGSMPRFVRVEPLNQQMNPDTDFALTPRVEFHDGDTWWTTLYDLNADVSPTDDGTTIAFDVTATLHNEDFVALPATGAEISLSYTLDSDATTLTLSHAAGETPSFAARFVLPVISPSGETVRRVSPHRVEVDKPHGTLVIESSAPLLMAKTERERVFNPVPGFEAIPLMIELPAEPGAHIECTLTVID